MCAQKKQILNYETLSTRYINDTESDMVQGDIVVLSRFSNEYIYVKFPETAGASLVFGVVLDTAKPNQPVQLAQLGTAKIRVDNSNGNIVAGDKIAAKGITGLGIKWTSNLPKSLVGFALEDYTSATAGLITCKILFNVSEAIIPSTATGEFITGTTFTIAQGHDNDENDFFRILFGEQTAGDSYISWDGANQRFIFGGDVVFEGSTFMAFDEIIELNADLSTSTTPTANCGLQINRGIETDAIFIWNETTDQFELGLEGNLSKIITEADLTSGGLTWPSAQQGDLLVGKTGGGGVELYPLSSGDTGDVLVNTGSTSAWGQISFTKEASFTIGLGNTDSRLYFIDTLSYFGVSSGDPHVIFSSTSSTGDYLRLISISGLESNIAMTDLNSSDYIGNLINLEITAAASVTNVYGLKVDALSNTANTTNLYALYVGEVTGATNNYSAYFNGHVHFNSTLYAADNTSNNFRIGSGSLNTSKVLFSEAGNFEIGYNSSNNTFGVINASYFTGGGSGEYVLKRFYSISGFESKVVFDVLDTNDWNVEETIANKFNLSVATTVLTPPEFPNSIIYNVYIDEINLSTFNIASAYNLYVKDVAGATTNNYSAYFEGKTQFQNRVEILGDSSTKGLTLNTDFILYNASGSGQITTTTSNKNITLNPHGTGKIILSKVASVATYTDASEPASGLPSDLWYNSTTKEFKTFDVDGTTKRIIAFIDSISGSNYVYTNTIQTITAQKTFQVPIASSVTNFTGTTFATNINSGVSVTGNIKSIEILRAGNSGPLATNNVGNHYSVYIGSPQSSDWSTRTATNAIGLYVEGPSVASTVGANWAAQFAGRVYFNNTATTNTSTSSFSSYIFETTQSANITAASITSATVRIGAPAIGGTANSTHIVASLYLNAPSVTDAKNRSIYAEGIIESDNAIVSLPSNLTNLASGHIRAGGTSIATINSTVNYHTLYANSFTNAAVSDSGSICISPFYNVTSGVTEALVNVRPFYGSGNNPTLGIRVWTVGSGTSHIGLAKPSTSSANVNAFSTSSATMLYSTSSGALFEVNGAANQDLIIRNTDATYVVNAAIEGGLVIGSTTTINERYLVLSSYSSSPSLANAGALYYNSSTLTVRAQVSNGTTVVNKDLEYKLYWEKDQFEFYETGYTGSTAGKINIDSQVFVDLTYQPADAESIIFLVRNAGSQLKDIDYTVNISGANKRITFETSLIDEIKLATNATDTVLIQVVYVRRDPGV